MELGLRDLHVARRIRMYRPSVCPDSSHCIRVRYKRAAQYLFSQRLHASKSDVPAHRRGIVGDGIMVEKKVAIIQCGRYGDICNILPIASELNRQGKSVSIYVRPNFSGLVQGIGYAEPVIWTWPQEDALVHAKNSGIYDEVFVTQRARSIIATNHLLGSWDAIGWAHRWHDLPLEMPETKNLPPVNPNLLGINLRAFTSRFPNPDTFIDAVRQAFPHCQIRDFSGIRVNGVRNLVPMIAECAVFLTVDTLTLHLSYATLTPTIAIQPESNWMSSEPRKHWIGKLKYSEAHMPDGIDKIKKIVASSPVSGTVVRRGQEMFRREHPLIICDLCYHSRRATPQIKNCAISGRSINEMGVIGCPVDKFPPGADAKWANENSQPVLALENKTSEGRDTWGKLFSAAKSNSLNHTSLQLIISPMLRCGGCKSEITTWLNKNPLPPLNQTRWLWEWKNSVNARLGKPILPWDQLNPEFRPL